MFIDNQHGIIIVDMLVVIFALAFVVVFANAHFADQSVSTFMILPKRGENVASVTLERSHREGTKPVCEFKYNTDRVLVTQAPTTAAPVGLKSAVSKVDITAPLHGKCFTRNIGYWDYEVCIHGTVKQFHGSDLYVLGKYVSDNVETGSDMHDGGTVCAPPGAQAKPRQAEVVFLCNTAPNAQTQVTQVDEPRPCEYIVMIATPLVCADSSFHTINAGEVVQVVDAAVKDGHEDWMLEISESAGGFLTCSARTTEPQDRSNPSKLRFAFVSLELRHLVDGEEVVTTQATRDGRFPIRDSMLQVFGSDDSSRGIASVDTFDGRLSALQISTDIKQ